MPSNDWPRGITDQTTSLPVVDILKRLAAGPEFKFLPYTPIDPDDIEEV